MSVDSIPAAFAFWRKCDFQIHSPRDPNWLGDRPCGIGDLNPATGRPAAPDEVDAARSAWADSFVARCVEKGLEAIAITDHHEMTMVRYVRDAIARRVVADPGFSLWLFPGMELTALQGVQCLILFDHDLSDDWCKQAQGRLGIEFANANPGAAKASKVAQLKCLYPDIGKWLDELTGLRHRFIVLPNVSQGGQHTVLTDGAHADFRRMSYVGGYLDRGQSLAKMMSKNQQRLSGKDGTWSTREIYPIPTSDSRSADFSALGTNDTWIKLAAPTAEALRQAFLGHRSRIAISKPAVPALVVKDVTVDGSTVLRPTQLMLSPELNSIIGGRGSGKSSFLEYVAFGLGRSCVDRATDGQYSGAERLRSLVNDTLTTKGGRVALTIIQDGAAFEVSRGPLTAYQPQVRFPNGSTQRMSPKELRALFPAVVYSQGELAELGKQAGRKNQLADLLQFVNPDFKRDEDRLSGDVEAAKANVRTALQELVKRWSAEARLHKLTNERDSLALRVEALTKTLPALSDDDQKIVEVFEKASAFESRRLQASKHADQITAYLGSWSQELLAERDLPTDVGDEATEFRARYKAMYRAFADVIGTFRSDVAAKRSEVANAENIWLARLTAAREARDQVLEKLGEHKTVTAQIIKLKEELTAATNRVADLDEELKTSGDPTPRLVAAVSDLRHASDLRSAKTVEWAAEIAYLSSGRIKAAVSRTGNISQLEDAIEVVTAKTGSQEAVRQRELSTKLEASGVWDVTDRLRTQAQQLLYWQLIGSSLGDEQPSCPDLFGIVGASEKIKAALTEKLDVARLEALSTAVPVAEIALSYTDGQREISFDKASEGQRAAALLSMLLAQEGGPLLVDQPEGDLDNRIITDLTDNLHLAKQKRQILFASHNANIVVNGSSELVGHLDVKPDGIRAFECAGAIDHPRVCTTITSTMEGGEKAFKDRQNKYGY